MRTFTSTEHAADAYRVAAAAAAAGVNPLGALHRAVAADPTFAVAATDLAVLAGLPLPHTARPSTRWERQHLDIVRAAARGQRARAAGLLREQLADSDDDIAVWIVSHA